MSRHAALLALVLVVGCHSDSGTETTPVPDATGLADAPCVGSLDEYCRLFGAACPTLDDSILRHKARCSEPGAWSVRSRHCVGLYRSVEWGELLLGGGEEYFDGDGRLIAAHLYTDYAAHCDGKSLSRTFGSVPQCETEPLSTDLCLP